MSQDGFDELSRETAKLEQEQAAAQLQERIEYAIIKTVQSIDQREFSEEVAEALGIEAGKTGQARDMLYNVYQGVIENPEAVENYVNKLLSAYGLEGQDPQVFEYASARVFAGEYTLPENSPPAASAESSKQQEYTKKIITNETIVEDVSTKVAQDMAMTPEEVIEFIQDQSVRDATPEDRREAIEASIVHAVQEDFSHIFMIPEHFSPEVAENFVMRKMNAVINGMEDAPKTPDAEAAAPAAGVQVEQQGAQVVAGQNL